MTSTARTGRRRRLLHDGATPGKPSESEKQSGSPATRYAPKAGSASYAIASRILPHSWLAIGAAFCTLALILVGLVSLEVLVKPYESFPVELLILGGQASLASWWCSALWLSVAAIAAVVFGLRRSRMDDLRCGYRWWAVGVLASVVMSAVVATDAHAWVASSLAQASGFSPLPANAFWWLAPGAVTLGFLAIRLIVDASESAVAVFFGGAALTVTALGWGTDGGLMPASIMEMSPWLGASVLGPAASMAGLSLAICSMLCLSRRIVRDAQGEVAPSVARAEKKPAEKVVKPRETTAKKKTSTTSPKAEKPAVASKPPPSSPPKVEEPTAWVGGGDDYQEEYDDQPQRRRLSKAERKRLRKQKARRAA